MSPMKTTTATLCALSMTVAFSAHAEAPPASPVRTSVAGVPDLSFGPVAIKAYRTSRRANGEGLAKHGKKKTLAQAKDHYLAALRADPGYLYARYNLACAEALSSDADRAIGLLTQLGEAGCPLCQERLAKASKDSDFRTLRRDPRFVALTKTAKVPKLAVKAASRKLTRGFAPARFAETFAAGLPVEIKVDAQRAKVFDAARPMKAWLNKDFEAVSDDQRWNISTDLYAFSCKAACCKQRPGDEGWCAGSMSPAVVEEVCFWPRSDRTLLPTYVKLQTCGL